MACEAPKTTGGQYCKKRECRIELTALKRYGVMGKFQQKRAAPTKVALRYEACSGTPIFIGSEGPAFPVSPSVIFGPDTPPLNIIGGYRFPGAPDLEEVMQ